MDPELDFPIKMLLVALPIFYLSGFLHEVGHAVMGWLCGYVVTSFGMGLGRPLWVGRCGTARVYGVPLACPVGQTVRRSDGAQILAVLLARGGGAAGPFRIRTARALRPLWEAVGDALGLWAHLLDAALAWRELGDAESARQL